MPKTFYILIFSAFIILVLAGIFLWSGVSDDFDNFIPAVKFEPLENYVITETEQGIVVENSNVGLTFRVPEGWTVEKTEAQLDEWIINVMSPDIEFGADGLLSEGCGFSVWVEEDEILANVVRGDIDAQEGLTGDKETIEVDGYFALRVWMEEESWGRIEAVKIPVKDRIFMFDTMFRPETAERCSEEFNKFLGEVRIE